MAFKTTLVNVFAASLAETARLTLMSALISHANMPENASISSTSTCANATKVGLEKIATSTPMIVAEILV
jgi:hypothetical protein